MPRLQDDSGERRTHADCYVSIYLKVFYYFEKCNNSAFLSCLSSVSLPALIRVDRLKTTSLVCELDRIL